MNCCKCWCVGACVLLVGLAGAGAWTLWGKGSPRLVPDEATPITNPHSKAPQVLAESLERLHQEALAHFHADPKNGVYRMPFVYDKIAKEWHMPYFSSVELGAEEAVPFQADMERIHQGSLKNFLSLQPLQPRKDPDNQVIVFDKNYDRSKKVWEAKSIDLVGLLKHDEPVVYVSEKVIANKTDPNATRPLDEFEVGGLNALEKGQNLFGRSRDGVIRLLGSVRADASCIRCHRDKKEGDLLGAFSYVLREAEYRRTPMRFGNAVEEGKKK